VVNLDNDDNNLNVAVSKKFGPWELGHVISPNHQSVLSLFHFRLFSFSIANCNVNVYYDYQNDNGIVSCPMISKVSRANALPPFHMVLQLLSPRNSMTLAHQIPQALRRTFDSPQTSTIDRHLH
jgi:hypothetical protein